jgi:hypothetical protein
MSIRRQHDLDQLGFTVEKSPSRPLSIVTHTPPSNYEEKMFKNRLT